MQWIVDKCHVVQTEVIQCHLLVHFLLNCFPTSAGVGRSGTFITIDAMMERLKEKDDLNIYQFVTEMRSKRTFMVQTMVSGCRCTVAVGVGVCVRSHTTCGIMAGT